MKCSKWLSRFLLCTLICLVVLADTDSQRTRAGDWPQILGPQRNGIAENETLLTKWPKTEPAVAWQMKVGEGFAGAAVQDGIAIIFHRVEDKEILEARGLEDGKTLWEQKFDTDYQARISPDTGPRCVPTIHAGQVFAFGASGDLHCVTLKDGKHLWSRDLFKDYDSDEGYFGAGSSPLVYDGKVYINVGGKKGGIVALSAKDGTSVWTATQDQASYSSPIIAEIDGKTRIVFVTRLTATAVDPSNGDEVFQFPFGERGPTVNGANPLVFDNKLFLTASYGIGAKMYDISGLKPKELWSNDRSLSSQYTTAIFYKGYLYGTHGREDAGAGSLRCIDIKDGSIKWSEDGVAMTHFILVGDKLLGWSVDGTLRLAEANPKNYQEIAKARIFDGDARALPALSQGKLLVRSNAEAGQASLKCLIVGE